MKDSFDATVNDMKRRSSPLGSGAPREKNPEAVAMGLRLRERSRAAEIYEQAELARKTGIPAGTVMSYWNGDRKITSKNALILAEILKTTATYLIQGEGQALVEGDRNVTVSRVPRPQPFKSTCSRP